MSEGLDYAALARSSSRAVFVDRAGDSLLIVGSPKMVRPESPARTGFFTPEDLIKSANEPATANELIVRAVKKTQEAFANMITVGRTANNDIQLHDTRISRFHAFFREAGGKLELGDAGSRHGTFVDGVKLEPKGPTLPVHAGSVLMFADLEFALCDAGACWERLQKRA
jgi:pSer/pThr/pTyr-binding forkhead associated (FHA) protein